MNFKEQTNDWDRYNNTIIKLFINTRMPMRLSHKLDYILLHVFDTISYNISTKIDVKL